MFRSSFSFISYWQNVTYIAILFFPFYILTGTYLYDSHNGNQWLNTLSKTPSIYSVISATNYYMIYDI